MSVADIVIADPAGFLASGVFFSAAY